VNRTSSRSSWIKTATGGERRRAEIASVSRHHGGFWQPTNLVYLLDRIAWGAERRLGAGRAYRLYRHATTPVRWLLKKRLWKDRYQA
jgi:hypothetical protein